MQRKPVQSSLYHRWHLSGDAAWAGVLIYSGVFRECADCNLRGFGERAAHFIIMGVNGRPEGSTAYAVLLDGHGGSIPPTSTLFIPAESTGEGVTHE